MKGLTPVWVPVREVGPRAWGRELLVAHTAQYLGKVLEMKAGHAGGLQYHRDKIETFYLFSGTAQVDADDGTGHLTSRVMIPGESCHISTGVTHRVTALEDCVFFETSTPHFDDRVRVEEDYGLPGGTDGLPTTPASTPGPDGDSV